MTTSNNNIFEEVLNDAQNVEEKLLGPSYPYYKNIKQPGDIGMTTDGSISALANDIEGLIAYVEILVEGGGKASVPGGPLGNKFFLQTAAKCLDTETKQKVDRYIYVNNVPDGNIPFISQGLGTNFSELKGLIPGAMGNLNVLNPFGLLQSFLSGSTPDCTEITMQTLDTNNVSGSETHYVTLTDIKNMDPCFFSDGVNPSTKKSCKESFNNGSGFASNAEEIILPRDPLAQFYFFSLACVSIYILYKIMEKH
jgi:hypothetical protein